MTESGPFLPGFAPICPRCGRAVVSQNHHKNWDHSDDRLENREGLCKECHMKEHREGFDGPLPYAPVGAPVYRPDRPGPPVTRDTKILAAAHWGRKKEDACEKLYRETIASRASSKTMGQRSCEYRWRICT